MSLMVFLVREETGVAGGNPLGHRENTADKLHTERPTKNNKRCVNISENASEGNGELCVNVGPPGLLRLAFLLTLLLWLRQTGRESAGGGGEVEEEIGL